MYLQGLLVGLGLGAGFMYLFDPEKGRRRRALARDKVIRFGDALADLAPMSERATRQVRDRARGVVHETRTRFSDEPVSDEILIERVRAEMGRIVSHPSAILVTATDGRITLSGPILTDEADRLTATVRAVRGVKEVEYRLECYDEAGDIPALQGEPRQSKRALR